MLKKFIFGGRRSKKAGKPDDIPGAEAEQQRLAAAPAGPDEVGGGSSGDGGLPPRPPFVGSAFDAPTGSPTVAGQQPGCHPAQLRQSCSGPPALDRASLTKYLSRDEMSVQVAPKLQQRVSHRLHRMSLDPQLLATAKATLRREAAEVYSLPKVSSEELLPELEKVLCLNPDNDPGSCSEEEADALATLGIEPDPEVAARQREDPWRADKQQLASGQAA